MTPFEKVMEKSFLEYRTSNTAFLQILYPAMRVGGTLGNMPAYIPVGKAPYDIDGFYFKTARYIACEVKESAKHESTMRVVPPDKKGTGLKYHQLEALVLVHENGGLACVVYNNGGEVGYLDGSRLKAAKAAIDTSLKAEAQGYPDAARGKRSIPWGDFQPVKSTGAGIPLWLPRDKQ